MTDYVTKDSGERARFASGMVRDTSTAKTRWHLIASGPMLRRWAGLLTRGAIKYAADNWLLASGKTEADRFRESAFRHFMQWYYGETDEDHAAAVFFNVNGYEYVAEKLKASSVWGWTRPQDRALANARAEEPGVYDVALYPPEPRVSRASPDFGDPKGPPRITFSCEQHAYSGSAPCLQHLPSITTNTTAAAPIKCVATYDFGERLGEVARYATCTQSVDGHTRHYDSKGRGWTDEKIIEARAAILAERDERDVITHEAP